jgi:hypothetical protein
MSNAVLRNLQVDAAVHPPSTWSSFEKAGFRFLFLFFTLFIILVNNGAYPYWHYLSRFIDDALHGIIPWIGTNILHLPYPITVFTNGSGDTTYDWVTLFSIINVSVFGCILWTLLDRRAANYRVLYYWLMVAIRFYVSLMLIEYGMVKVFKLQFESPGLTKLTQTYGDSSPMGLAWTFFGFSNGYNFLIGILEIATVLLLFRRTMAAGALITLVVVSNIVAINYFYDVPVKIMSTTLLAMTLFILSHDAKRLLQFFFLHKSVELQPMHRPQVSNKWMPKALIVFKAIILIYMLPYNVYAYAVYYQTHGVNTPRPKLFGIYETTDFIINGKSIEPLTTDSIRWERMIIESNLFAYVKNMKDVTVKYNLRTDTARQTIKLMLSSDTSRQLQFHYTSTDSSKLILKGIDKNDSIQIHFNRYSNIPSRFSLMRRGFHWINEHAYDY